MKLSFDFSFKASRIVRLFVLADLALLSGWGLIGPVFAIFIVEQVQNATVVTVGISAAIYWAIKGIIQIPIANFLDKTPSEKDDYTILILGLVLAGLSALAYIFVTQIWQLYLVQAIHATAFGMYNPSWSGIFSRHLDKQHEALDWSLDNTAMALAAAVTGLVSGVLVAWLGFSTIFILGGLFSFISAAVIFSVPRIVFPHRIHKRRSVLRDHKPITTPSDH